MYTFPFYAELAQEDCGSYEIDPPTLAPAIVESILNCLYIKGEITRETLIYTNPNTFNLDKYFALMNKDKGRSS